MGQYNFSVFNWSLNKEQLNCHRLLNLRTISKVYKFNSIASFWKWQPLELFSMLDHTFTRTFSYQVEKVIPIWVRLMYQPRKRKYVFTEDYIQVSFWDQGFWRQGLSGMARGWLAKVRSLNSVKLVKTEVILLLLNMQNPSTANMGGSLHRVLTNTRNIFIILLDQAVILLG